MQLLLINSRINNAFYNLRSNQLPIDPPASEDQAAIIAQAEDNDLLSSFPVLLTVGGVHVGLPTIDPERIAVAVSSDRKVVAQKEYFLRIAHGLR